MMFISKKILFIIRNLIYVVFKEKIGEKIVNFYLFEIYLIINVFIWLINISYKIIIILFFLKIGTDPYQTIGSKNARRIEIKDFNIRVLPIEAEKKESSENPKN